MEIGTDLLGNLQRLNNALEILPEKMADVKQKLSNVEHQLETAKMKVKKPFSQEFNEKQGCLTELTALLNIDEKGNGGNCPMQTWKGASAPQAVPASSHAPPAGLLGVIVLIAQSSPSLSAQ